jgi:ribonucleoside-triphosphate reductase
MDVVETFNEYLNQSDWRVKENSNSQYCFGGLNKYLLGKASALYWEDLYNKENPEIIKGHRNGDYHIHDLGSFSSYCFGGSLQELLLKGIVGVKNISVSAPAKRLQAVTAQISNIVTIFQNEIAGAVAFSSWNVYLAPFVYFDALKKRGIGISTTKEKLEYTDEDINSIRQSVEGMVYQLNSNSRMGSEPAFSNLTLDFNVLTPMVDKLVIYGGQFLEGLTYGQFQEEADLLLKIFSEVMLKGDYEGKPFAYPIPTFNIGKNVNWDKHDCVYELAAKNGSPYFGNFIHGNLQEEDVYSMCPLTEDTEVYTKSCKGVMVQAIKQVVSNLNKGCDIQVLTPSGWSKAKPRVMPITKVLRVYLSNGCFVDMGENHLQPVKDLGTLSAKDLQVGMWLPAKKDLIGINESKLGNKELGFAIGAYIGDGSHDGGALIFSLDSKEKDDETELRITKVFSNLGFDVVISSCKGNVRTVRVNGGAYNLVKLFVTGDDVFTKVIDKRIYNMSIEFIEGLFEGFEATDGSRSKKRYYTSSTTLRDQIQQICNFFGKKAIATYEDTRENRYSEKPNYRIDLPERSSYGLVFNSDELFNYYSIVKIEEVTPNSSKLYCLEVEDDSHLFLLGSGIYTHNCRLRLNKKELINKTGGLFGAGEKTGSLGVFTINLPAIGYRNTTEELFFSDLRKQMELGYDQLLIKKKVIDRHLEDGLFPALKEYLGSTRTLFLTIGLVGGHEMCVNFLGSGIETKVGKDFTIKVIHFMRDILSEFQEKSGLLFNLEYTPAESTSYRLAMKDKKRYSNIFTSGEREPYYTNSTHLPVGLDLSFKEIYEHQNGLLSLATGGSVYHNYLDGSITKEAVKHFLKVTFTNYDLPYISFSPVYSICQEHGFLSGHHDKCPHCDEDVTVYQRITGYVRPIENFNKGKLEEYKQRIQRKGEI